MNFRASLDKVNGPVPVIQEEAARQSDQSAERYQRVLREVGGTWLMSTMLQHHPSWEEALGFGPYGVSALAATGMNPLMPGELNLLVGEFDHDNVEGRLRDLGYGREDRDGYGYYVLPGSAAGTLARSLRLAVDSEARAVSVQPDILLTGSQGDMVADALAARAGAAPSLLDDPGFGDLSELLQDALFVGLLPRGAVLMPEVGGGPELSGPLEGWKDLGEWEVLGLGYGRQGGGERLVLSIWYPPHLDVESAEAELLRRVTTYNGGLGQSPWGLTQRLCGERWQSEVRVSSRGATAEVHCAVPPGESSPGLSGALWNALDVGSLRVLLSD